jgi:hypothetical protein
MKQFRYGREAIFLDRENALKQSPVIAGVDQPMSVRHVVDTDFRAGSCLSCDRDGRGMAPASLCREGPCGDEETYRLRPPVGRYQRSMGAMIVRLRHA